jgi:Raf kinase inhibitor-like YbhB/YbcL family protein
VKKAALFSIMVIGLSALGYGLYLSRATKTNNSGIQNKSFISNMLITSPSFKDGEKIPIKFSCDGGDINPELQIQNVPVEARSLALIVDDPDATHGGTFTHWFTWNINPATQFIKEESVPPGAQEGTNDFGNISYGGPCPPKGNNPHHYHFKLYALDAMLNLSQGAGKSALEAEINKHLITKAELVGLYRR